MGVLIIAPENCTNCHSCELACSLFHEEEFNPARARVEVKTWDENTHSAAVMCMQCEEAGCMAICPAGAITEDKATGARLVNQSKCIKCRMCIQICPFGGNFLMSGDIRFSNAICAAGIRSAQRSVLRGHRVW